MKVNAPRKTSWVLLVISLPTENATTRMRIWRALKGMGCAALRDGVYLLPHSDEDRQNFAQLAEEVIDSGGNAHLLEVPHTDVKQSETFALLFDRTDDYAKLLEEMENLKLSMTILEIPAMRRALKALRRNFEFVAAIDYFPGAARQQVAEALEKLENALLARMSPGEPRPVAGEIKRLDRKDFQRKLWATRKRPWIDRLASAWLIRFFIDPKARFLWLEKPADCPPDAIGFDFDGATFTHIGSRVTFEVLLASFGLEEECGLARFAALIHYLDAGGIPVPEAGGLEAMITGARMRCSGDDELLAEVCRTFDCIYSAFAEKT